MINESRIMNVQSLKGIFGKCPNLLGSELMNVEINRDGPAMRIKVMTKEGVINKPKKWLDFNVVYIELLIIGISKLKISELGTNNIIKNLNIDLENGENVFRLVCENDMSIFCNFAAVRIQGIKTGLV